MLACRSAHFLQIDFPRLLHQLVSCGVGPMGRRLARWARGGQKLGCLCLLPTLFAEGTGVLKPLSQHWLLSSVASAPTEPPIHLQFQLHSWPLPTALFQTAARQSPSPFTPSFGVEAVPSGAGHQTAPPLPAGLLVLRGTSSLFSNYSEWLLFFLLALSFAADIRCFPSA